VTQSVELPRSATSLPINTVALLNAVATLAILVTVGAAIPATTATCLLIASYVIPVVVLEAIYLRRDTQPIKTDYRPTFDHILTKLLGLAGTLGFALFIYWLFPEYRGDFYNTYYNTLRSIAPAFALLSVPYVLWMDRKSSGERDGYWHMGQLLRLRLDTVDFAVIWQHLLGWLVKVFFLPLMYTYLVGKIGYYRGFDYSLVFSSFKAFFDFTLQNLFFLDLLIACVGYVMTFKASDSHIRSTEPTMLGWFVAIVCYQPFWSLISPLYIDYETGKSWGAWFWEYPIIYSAWGSAILILTAIFTWCTLCFGIRFSNLTHRGILTNGPYRYCKHPAYLSKNLSFWLISMPFMINTDAFEALRHSLMLLLLNGIYLLRARTEERHLSADPVYRQYAAWIEQHGLLRRVGQWFPVLRFSPGRLFATGTRE
jgi:protein-S-isoprenylcysteine O-methyltransferase Ste14